MIHYRNVKIPYIEPMSLDVVDNTFNTLQQGHIKALELRNQLETAIANLDMDQSEDAFKAELINGINDSINKSTIGGNMYYAMGEIINQQGNVAKNPAIIGRLKANQARKEFLDTIKNRTDLNDDAKVWAEEMNPYHYEDKYDENGNIVGGTEWKPAINPVKHKDFNEVLRLAAQYASPESGNISSVTYLDANGNPTKEATNSIGILSETTGTWTRLSEDKLRQGLETAFRANPEYEASLKQDWTILNWKWNKGDEDSMLRDPITGNPYSYEQFKESIISPFLRAKSYYNQNAKTDYHDASFKALNSIRQSGGGLLAAGTSQPYNQTSGIGYNISIKDDTGARAAKTVELVGSNIRNHITELLPDIKLDLSSVDITDSDKLSKSLRDAGADEDSIANIVNYAKKQYYINKDSYDLYNRLLEDNSEASAAQLMRYVVNNGITLSKDDLAKNPILQEYYSEYMGIINQRYKNRNNYGYAVNTREKYDELIAALGGSEETVRNLGFNVSQDNGKFLISIDKNHSNLVGMLEGAVQNTYNNYSNKRKLGQHFARLIGIGDGFVTFENGGNKYYSQNPSLISGLASDIRNLVDGKNGDYYHEINTITKNNIAEQIGKPAWKQILYAPNMFIRDSNRLFGVVDSQNPSEFVGEGLGEFNDRMMKKAEPLGSEERVIQTNNFLGINPQQNEAYQTMLSTTDSKVRSQAHNNVKDINEAINTLLSSGSAMNGKVYVVDRDTNLLNEVNSGDKAKINKWLNDPSLHKSYTMNYNPYDGTITPQITIDIPDKLENPFTNKKGEPLTITSDNLINDESIRELNGSEEYAIASKFYKNDLNDINTNVGFYIDDSGYHTFSLGKPQINYNGETLRSLYSDYKDIDNVPEAQAQYIFGKVNTLANISQLSEEAFDSEEGKDRRDAFIVGFLTDKVLTKYFGANTLTKMVSTYLGEDILNQIVSTYF